MSSTVANQVSLNKLPDSIFNIIGNRMAQAITDSVMPAAALSVFHYDTPILNAAWGWVDDEQTIPVMPDTLFDIGSVTRMYTTIALLAQISNEQIYLHSPIVSKLPEFGAAGKRSIAGGQDPDTGKTMPVPKRTEGMYVDSASITCFHLLTHTSGLPMWRDLYTINPPPAAPTDDVTQHLSRWETAREALYRYPFANLPEISVIESDIGYLVMGDLIAQIDETSVQYGITNRSTGDRFSNTLFNPLKHKRNQHAIAPSTPHNSWRGRKLWGEVYDDNASSIGGVAGHAGLFSTAFEMGLTGNIWLNHAEKLLKIDAELAGAAVELQSQTGSDRFGLGWMLKPQQKPAISDRLGTRSYGFQSDTGSSIWIDPAEQLVITLLTNHSYSDADNIAYYALRRDIHNLLIDFVQR